VGQRRKPSCRDGLSSVISGAESRTHAELLEGLAVLDQRTRGEHRGTCRAATRTCSGRSCLAGRLSVPLWPPSRIRSLSSRGSNSFAAQTPCMCVCVCHPSMNEEVALVLPGGLDVGRPYPSRRRTIAEVLASIILRSHRRVSLSQPPKHVSSGQVVR
jgi:hypothetical protein